MTSVARPRLGRQGLTRLGFSLLVVGTGLGVHGIMRAQSQVSAAPVPAIGTIDPRLIVKAHTVPFSGSLANGVQVSGSLYPGLPGANTLHLVLRQAAALDLTGGSVHVSATMPGMRMIPATATLVPQATGYTGTISLPMFGAYRAQLIAATRFGTSSGSVTLTLPLQLAR